VYANDQLITALCAQGCLELNAYLPVIGHALLESIKLLIGCDTTLRENLISGMAVHPENTWSTLYRCPAITTALVPRIGYHKASDLAKYMKINNIDVFAANSEMHLLPDETLRSLLRPENLLKLGYTVGDRDDGA
jgi:aspartate ammonia-lyase